MLSHIISVLIKWEVCEAEFCAVVMSIGWLQTVSGYKKVFQDRHYSCDVGRWAKPWFFTIHRIKIRLHICSPLFYTLFELQFLTRRTEVGVRLKSEAKNCFYKTSDRLDALACDRIARVCKVSGTFKWACFISLDVHFVGDREPDEHGIFLSTIFITMYTYRYSR